MIDTCVVHDCVLFAFVFCLVIVGGAVVLLDPFPVGVVSCLCLVVCSGCHCIHWWLLVFGHHVGVGVSSPLDVVWRLAGDVLVVVHQLFLFFPCAPV